MMKISPWIEKGFHQTVDAIFARWPRPMPQSHLIQHCKIVSHRGEHDNRRVLENTCPAFDRARDARVWGIEFDVRWTKDLRPVVAHDRDLKRVFDADTEIAQVTLADLKAEFPLVPSLEEVVKRYGKKLHLMVEIKDEPYPDPELQNERLSSILSSLTPRQDYHLLSLSPGIFDLIDTLPGSAFLPIARIRLSSLSRTSLARQYGGITGHYLFVPTATVKRHQAKGQAVGTGFVGSKNCLFRELNRGVDWIFSNDAVKMQAILKSLSAN